MPVWPTLKKWIRKVALVGVLASPFIVGGLYGATAVINSVQPKENRTAILVSDWQYGRRSWSSPLFKALAYVPLTLIFNADGYRVDWILHAESSDLERIMKDAPYSIVFPIGHGSYSSWCASDREVFESDIREWTTYPKEEFLQLSCAEKSGEELGSSAAKNTYHYNVGECGIVPQTLMAIDIFTGLPVLKGKAEYTDQPYYFFSLYYVGEDNLRGMERAQRRLFENMDVLDEKLRHNRNSLPPERERPQPGMVWALYVLVNGRRNF